MSIQVQAVQAQKWVRYQHAGAIGFGTLSGATVHEHRGDMFAAPEPTGRTLALHAVKLLSPTQPTKVIALWNNFAALGAKLNLAVPAEPLYLLKSPNSFANPGDVIRQPRSGGKVVFEGELG
ncbi:MAG: Rv2993c-like domain-containing protein, partial [Burkholderiales bacterium]